MSRVACIIRTCLAVVFVLSVTAVGGGQRLNAPDPAQMEEAPDLGYRPVKHGLAIPADMELGPPSSVAWTTNDTLLLLNRGPNPLMEFDENGEFVRSWGQGEYVRPHGLRIDPDGNIWTADDRGHRVTKMNPGGDVLMTIGTKGEAGEAVDGLLNEPTDVAVNAAGEIFVVVGHGSGEPRVIKFDSSGTLMTSWGGQGTGPGQFDTPPLDRRRSGRARLCCRPAESPSANLHRWRRICGGEAVQRPALRSTRYRSVITRVASRAPGIQT